MQFPAFDYQKDFLKEIMKARTNPRRMNYFWKALEKRLDL